MSKRIRSLLVIILAIFLFLFLYYGDFDCLFKKYLGIICPGCGMSRAIDEIFKFNFIGSFKYNILALPVLIIGILLIIGFIYDFIFNTDRFWNLTFNLLSKYYILIIIIVLISYIVNIYRGI